MLVSAPRRHTTTRVLVLIVLVAACSKAKPAKSRDATIAASPPADAGPAGEASPAGTITITVGKDKPPGKALAKRCILGGDPAAADCSGGGEGLALDRAGVLYLVVGKEVRRYKRADGDECRFEPTGDPIAMPPDNPRPQPIDGPVYMRSGGAAWHVAAAGDAVYAHDYLGGLFRIDSGKAVPACVDVFGFGSVAPLGKKLVIGRNGIEQLALGKKCKASSAKIDDKVHGAVHTIRDTLYVSRVDELTRYNGRTPVKLGEGTRICAITGLTACGDGICAMDQNCMQVIQFGADGKVVRTLESDQLFANRPWTIGDAVTRDDGTVFVYTRHRDKAGDKEICEAAVYELPAALFAL